MPCIGDSSKICGSEGYNSVYHYITDTIIDAGIPIIDKGCYIDVGNDRDLGTWCIIKGNLTTMEKCAKGCFE